MNTVDSTTDRPAEYPQTVRVRTHSFHADISEKSGGADSAPGPHDYFDASLAACKALTAQWYAKRHAIPLERVDSHVESDDTDERKGIYRFKVRVTFHGAALTDEHRAQLARAIEACPIHKLMTTADVQIEMLG